MLVEKKTSGHAAFSTKALTSVPTAPASSGFTVNQLLVAKPGAEICAPGCVAMALLCTCQPPRPTVSVLAEAAVADNEKPMAPTKATAVATRARTPNPLIASPSPSSTRTQGKSYSLGQLTIDCTVAT